MSLSPRLIAIQGIEFTPVQIAVQGLLDYLAAGGRLRHRSTTKLRLQKIRDVRHRLGTARAATTARGLGQIVTNPPIPTIARIELPPLEIIPGPVPTLVIQPPTRIDAKTAIKATRCVARVQKIAFSVQVKAKIALPRVSMRGGCALAPRASARVELRPARATGKVDIFDDVYAEQREDDDEDLIAVATLFV